jgi:phosphoglycerate kinase
VQFLSATTEFPGKKALVRADLDVPMDEEGNIVETFRLDALVPTLEFLKKHDIEPVIAGHIGRPEGQESRILSTQRLAPYFDNLLGPNSYTLLENLRFNPGENSKDTSFAAELASKADFYVNESFATCHRDTASINLVPTMIPSFAGLRLEKELENLEKIFEGSPEPKVALVGGVKESKQQAIEALAEYFDYVLVGGALKKPERLEQKANIFYPLDYTEDGLDLGPRTLTHYSKILADASTVVWAGPVGAYDQGYYEGSRTLAEAILESADYSLVGGGDTVTCLNQLDLLNSFDFVSTGGGAMLDFLSKEELPGLEALGYYG